MSDSLRILAELRQSLKEQDEKVLKEIERVLNNWAKRWSAHLQYEVSYDANRREFVASYRSGLPKEGAYAVGEYEYEEMVDKEIAKSKPDLDRMLSQFSDYILRAELQDEEKSWIYAFIPLK